jgi:hypothetical protein
MNKFTVRIHRTATRSLDFEVEADTREEANDTAVGIAGDWDFSDGKDCGAEYYAEIIGEGRP